MQRGGELLAKVTAAQGGDRKSTGRQRPVDRKSVAEAAGLSPRQAKQMLRVASISGPEFEAMVEAVLAAGKPR